MNKITVLLLSLIISACQLESQKNDSTGYNASDFIKVVDDINLTAIAETGALTANWNNLDGYSKYQLYISNESFSELKDLDNYASLDGGRFFTIEQGKNRYKVSELKNGKYYFAVVTATATETGNIKRSNEINILVRNEGIDFQAPVNDSGLRNRAAAGNTCDIPQKDCLSGRDFTHNDDSDGVAGFSFTKLDESGNELLATADNWHCVKDNVTGLIWEVKTDHTEPSLRTLRDKRWIYSYYKQRFVDSDGSDGIDNGPPNYGTDRIYGGPADIGINSLGDFCGNDQLICTSEQYVKDVNTIKLCGYTDWRIPRYVELFSLKILNEYELSFDKNYFPDTQDAYLTSDYKLSVARFRDPETKVESDVVVSNGVLNVRFDGNSGFGSYRNSNYGSVRLVRGGN